MERPRLRTILPCAFALLAALAMSGCGDDEELPPHASAPTYTATFSGYFAGTGEAGALTFTVTMPQPWGLARSLLGPSSSGGHITAPVVGLATFDGVTTTAVNGTYFRDESTYADSIYFTTNNYTFIGYFVPYLPALRGHFTGAHEGVFECRFDSYGDVEIYAGAWGKSGEAAIGRMGLVARAGHVRGAFMLANGQTPFVAYEVHGTIAEGDPPRAISAGGRGVLDSLHVAGAAAPTGAASPDTAGGSWEAVPITDATIGDGWWHAARFRSMMIQTAQANPR